MKTFGSILLLLSLVASSLSADCQWSPCEGKLIRGQQICNQYGLGTYTGRADRRDCSWTTTKAECCKKSSDGECKWTSNCYGSAYGAKSACRMDFGSDWIGTETSTEGCGYATQKHYCCN